MAAQTYRATTTGKDDGSAVLWTSSDPRKAYEAARDGLIVMPDPTTTVEPGDVTPESAYTPDPYRLGVLAALGIDARADAESLRTLARDLYEIHLRTGISLDKWQSARAFVERFYGPIVENGG